MRHIPESGWERVYRSNVHGARDGDLRTDCDLWQTARIGDSDAFRDLYLRHSGRIQAYALRRMRSIDDAEDVVLEVFMALWVRRATVECDSERGILPWLFTVAKHSAIAHSRKAIREPLLVGDTTDLLNSGLKAIATQTLHEELLGMIADLPRQDCVMATMAWVWGYTSAEIGEAMDIPSSTVRWHLGRLRRQVDREWRRDGGEQR